MTIHLIKLCVGIDAVDALERSQARRLKRGERLFHTTRMVPKRADEVVEGGSLYWVIKGLIQVRQRVVAIEPFTDGEGIGRCRLVFDPELVTVRPAPRRAFQGWRYFTPEDAPPDLPRGSEIDGMPSDMRAELAELGLI